MVVMRTSKIMDVEKSILELHTWLNTTAIDLKDQHTFVDAYCLKLRDLGVPCDRVFIGASVLHPQVAARAWKWIDGNITDFSWTRPELGESKDMNDLVSEDRRKDAPILQLATGAKFVRIRVTDEVKPDDVDWMETDNYTDLYALPSPKTGQGKLEGGFTWATKAEEGFTDEHIRIFDETLLSLATILRIHVMKFTSKSLLMMYLGEDAGSRVYDGEILRGEGLVIRSVIWFSDIRNFTKMSSELSRTEILDIVNQVSEITAEVIRKNKGQLLKFMGDGIMAIFSNHAFQRSSLSETEKRQVDEHAASLCYNARMAAAELQCKLATFRKTRQEQGKHGASVGVGLHYGDVSYGNIGAPERLDFTVLGPHVNLASRTESLCSKLGAKVLCTGDLHEFDNDKVWHSRGRHAVKGVAEPVEIYELKACCAQFRGQNGEGQSPPTE